MVVYRWGRIIPNNTGVERAVASGEKRFDEILTAAAISSASFKDVVGLSGNRVADPLQNRWIGDAPHNLWRYFGDAERPLKKRPIARAG